MSLNTFILALFLTVVILGASSTSAITDPERDADWGWYNRGMGVRFIDDLAKRGNGLGSGRYVRCIKKGTDQRCFCDMVRSPRDPGYYVACSKFSLDPEEE
nr:uncharacterized protein LOC129266674 [Lytechinus pictus]